MLKCLFFCKKIYMLYLIISKFARKSILQLSFLLFLSSCTHYKVPTSHLLTHEPYQNQALTHPLYNIIPRHRSQLYWYDLGHWITWMLFGNDDDGIFGEGKIPPYRPQQQINCWKALRWMCRNPLHNVCFYVIGSAHKVNSEFTIIKCSPLKFSLFYYRPFPEPNFEKKSSFFLGFHGWKPFIFLNLVYNQHHRGQFYLGWRERGNFGFKFLPYLRTKRKIINPSQEVYFQ